MERYFALTKLGPGPNAPSTMYPYHLVTSCNSAAGRGVKMKHAWLTTLSSTHPGSMEVAKRLFGDSVLEQLRYVLIEID